MIKNILEKTNIKKSKLAKDLKLSRPTFDSYIYLYDNAKNLPSLEYQNIFDYLFSSNDINSFIYRYHLLISNDLKVELKNIQIKEKINNFVNQTEDENILNYLFYILSVYDEFNNALITHFNILNKTNKNKIFNYQQMTLLSNLHNIYNLYYKNQLKFNDIAYQDLMKNESKADENCFFQNIYFLLDNNLITIDDLRLIIRKKSIL